MSKLSRIDISKLSKTDMSKLSRTDMSKLSKTDMSKLSRTDMSKLSRIDKTELIRLSKITSASALAFKNNIKTDDVYYIYKKHNIQNLLKYSPRFIKAFHKIGRYTNNEICNELGITYEYLLRVATSEKVSSCRFEKANEICKSLNYKGSIDYIEKNGVYEFRRNIRPQII